MEKFTVIGLILVFLCSCAQHPVRNRTVSSIGGVKLFQSEIAPESLLNNVVELRFIGAHGTGIYIGNGRFLTAAHNFTLRNPDLEKAISQSVTLSRVDGTKFDFNEGDIDVLFDPESESYVTGQHGRLSILFENDLAILKINDPDRINEFEEGAHFTQVTEAHKGGHQSLQVGDRVIGVGLNWEPKEGAALTNAIVQIFGHRDVDTNFSYITSTVDSFQETLPGSQSLKVYGIPDTGSSAQPGDSGGPIIKRSSDGTEVLVGVHHGRKPAGENELSEFWAAQLIEWKQHERFLSPFSSEWKQKVRPVTKERIAKLDNQVIRSFLTAALDIRQGEIAWKSTRKTEFKKLFNLLYMNALNDDELEQVLKIFYRFSLAEPNEENLLKVKTLLSNVFPSEAKGGCDSLIREFLH